MVSKICFTFAAFHFNFLLSKWGMNIAPQWQIKNNMQAQKNIIAMSIEDQEIVKQEAYAEAMHYVQKARKILQKTGHEDNHYHDRKVVRRACGKAYSGTLVALDAWLRLNNVPEAKPKSIDYYRKSIGQIDRKLFYDVDGAYKTLYIAGHYDGNLRVPVIQDGFNVALDIIERIKPAQPIDPEVWEARRRKRSLFGRLYTMLFV
jgi:hypothetical protein